MVLRADYKWRLGLLMNAIVGKKYVIRYPHRATPFVGKLIKVSKTGYNFLNEETNECVMWKNIYPRTKIKKRNLPEGLHLGYNSFTMDILEVKNDCV